MFTNIVKFVVLTMLCWVYSISSYSIVTAEELKENTPVVFYKGFWTHFSYVDYIMNYYKTHICIQDELQEEQDKSHQDSIEKVEEFYTTISNRFEENTPSFRISNDEENNYSVDRINGLVEKICMFDLSKRGYCFNGKGHVLVDLAQYEIDNLIPKLEVSDGRYGDLLEKTFEIMSSYKLKLGNANTKKNGVNRILDVFKSEIIGKDRHSSKIFYSLLCAGYVESVIEKKEFEYVKYLNYIMSGIRINFNFNTFGMRGVEQSHYDGFIKFMRSFKNVMRKWRSIPIEVDDTYDEKPYRWSIDLCSQFISLFNKNLRVQPSNLTNPRFKEIPFNINNTEESIEDGTSLHSEFSKFVSTYISESTPGIYIYFSILNKSMIVVLKENANQTRLFSTCFNNLTFSCGNCVGRDVWLAMVLIQTLSGEDMDLTMPCGRYMEVDCAKAHQDGDIHAMLLNMKDDVKIFKLERD